MASIDWGTLGLGALIGIGCRKQLRAAGRVAASTAASLAGVAAQAAEQVAKETEKSSGSAEEKAAEEWLRRIDQKLQADQSTQGAQGNGKNG